MSMLLRAYTSCLHRAPVTTQAVSTGVLWSIGDALAQRLERDRHPYNARRAVYTGAFATAIVGPSGHWWYGALDRFFVSRLARGSPAFVAGKVAADCAVFGPVHVVAFFAVLGLAEGKSLAQVREKIAEDFWPTYAGGLLFWPAIQAANFTFVKPSMHLMVVNIAELGDSAFLSWARANDGWFDELVAAWRGGKAGAGSGDKKGGTESKKR